MLLNLVCELLLKVDKLFGKLYDVRCRGLPITVCSD